MKTYNYDLIIVGGGPIAASTAYFLDNSNKKIALIKPEPQDSDENHISTYLYAGGSIRSYFDDEEIKQATSETMDFIKNLKSQNVDLSLIEDFYCFLNKGIVVPSVNVSGFKLVNYFLNEAKNKGIEIFEKTYLEEIIETEDKIILKTNNGEFSAPKVLLAIGHSINKILKEREFNFIKRQLFVLDLKLSEEQKRFPHLILPFKDGVIYVFVKIVDGEYRFVLGQEDIIEEDDKFEATNYFDELKNMGAFENLKFLKNAGVLKILWGFDAENKKLKVYNKNNKIYAACCGSAVRSSVYIGKKLNNILNS